MKAIIMAGGEGTRLRPLTCNLPKPLMPLLNKPVMAYAMDLLARHGIYDVGATLAYAPGKIMERFGEALRYFVEEEPLGTAGSVRAARDFLTETFVVLSGDGLTDADLTRAYAFHRQNGAMATLLLAHADDPQPYGGVVTDREGRVRHFVEKPDWPAVASDLVNTGIYILEPQVLDRIPEGKYDFGKDLFPEMVKAGLPVYGYPMHGYWCDIGDVGAYLEAQWDLLRGRVARPFGVRRLPDTRMGRDVVLESPCCIGRGCVLGDGARILAGSVLGDRVYVGPGAVIERSVLWDGASVGAGAQVSGCAVADGVQIGAGAILEPLCVLGSGSTVGKQAHVAQQVRIWPGHRVEGGAQVRADLRWSPKASLECENARFQGAFLPEELCAFGAAFAHALGLKKVCAGYGETPQILPAAQSFLAGAASAGALGVLTSAGPAATVFGASQESADGAALLTLTDGQIALDLFYQNRPLTPPQADRVRKTLGAMDFARVPYDRVAPPLLRPQMQRTYAAWKQGFDPGKQMFYGDVNEAGELTLYDPDGKPLAGAVRDRMIRRAVDYHCGEGDPLLRTLAELDPSLALSLLGSYLEKTVRTLGELLLECGSGVEEENVPCEDRFKGAAMRRFLAQVQERGQTCELRPDGAVVSAGEASVRLAPRQNSAAIGVQVRAMTQEFAGELMGAVQKDLEAIVRQLQDGRP